MTPELEDLHAKIQKNYRRAVRKAAQPPKAAKGKHKDCKPVIPEGLLVAWPTSYSYGTGYATVTNTTNWPTLRQGDSVTITTSYTA